MVLCHIQKTRWGKSSSAAEMQPYSTAPANWTVHAIFVCMYVQRYKQNECKNEIKTGMRINFYLLRTFFLILVVFVLLLLSLRFGQISPLAFFRWFTATSDRNAEWCDRQQQWKAVITGDTVTRLSIPIRGRSKSPEEGQRWNLAET